MYPILYKLLSRREGRFISISNHPCCRASFCSDAVCCTSLRGSYATCMRLVPGWVAKSLHVTFGGRGGIMTTAGLELPCPCYIPQGYLCVKLGLRLLKGGSNVTERGKIYKHFKQPFCRVSFCSNAV